MGTVPSRRSRIWFRLLASLLVALGTLEGGVLCFDAEGHVALERAQQVCCEPDGERDAGPLVLSVQAEPDDDCGPCVDVPLSTTGSLARSHASKHRAPAPQTLVPWLPLRPILSLPLAFSRTPGGQPPLSDSGLSSLRSTVLLI